MFDVGRLCIKIAGRDAGGKCVVIDVLDKQYVLIDGMVRRRKCNTAHLEPLNETIEIHKNASHDEVARAFKELGLEVRKSTPKSKTEKPKKAVVHRAATNVTKKAEKAKAVKAPKIEKKVVKHNEKIAHVKAEKAKSEEKAAKTEKTEKPKREGK